MPIREIEYHPYLTQDIVSGATKLILGSFPVYECTDADNETKKENRENEGTVRFFYGSNRNGLWNMYSRYIDSSISPPWNSELILKSLEDRQIALSDTIVSCERYKYTINKKTGEKIINPYSSEDSALKNKVWNKEIINSLINNGVSKILCTSKGVLEDLEKHIICCDSNTIGDVDTGLSLQFQSEFLKTIGGNNQQIAKGIAKVFVSNSKLVYALAIPSPGSPQRQIHQFGCYNQDKMPYAKDYFKFAFRWLME